MMKDSNAAVNHYSELTFQPDVTQSFKNLATHDRLLLLERGQTVRVDRANAMLLRVTAGAFALPNPES